jgi:hypothetical protein
MTNKSPSWRFGLLGQLSKKSSPRIMTFPELHKLAGLVRPGISDTTVRTAIEELKEAGALLKISNGLYMNKRSLPAPSIAEAARFIRKHAVVSLQSVLGECGVTNNPSAIVTCVVPLSATSHPNLGTVQTESGATFRFFGLPERFFPPKAGKVRELFISSKPCPCFIPEKALLDWLYLGNSISSKMTPPPFDIDPEMIDWRRARDLAEKIGMSQLLEDYFQKGRELRWGVEPLGPRSAPKPPAVSSTKPEPVALAPKKTSLLGSSQPRKLLSSR